MVGQQPLKLFIQVRILVPELSECAGSQFKSKMPKRHFFVCAGELGVVILARKTVNGYLDDFLRVYGTLEAYS